MNNRHQTHLVLILQVPWAMPKLSRMSKIDNFCHLIRNLPTHLRVAVQEELPNAGPRISAAAPGLEQTASLLHRLVACRSRVRRKREILV